jgi:hypothetical protein
MPMSENTTEAQPRILAGSLTAPKPPSASVNPNGARAKAASQDATARGPTAIVSDIYRDIA